MDDYKKLATLFTGCLNDDFIYKEGEKIYIGYFTPANEWSDRGRAVEFENVEGALDWYIKSFKDRVLLEGYKLREEWREDDPTYSREYTTDDDALEEWRDVVNESIALASY